MKKANPDESSPSFPAPKPQDLMMLAIKIQKKENVYVMDAVQSNPRILCSSSEAPTILQEGARYNALHIAARWGNTDAASCILSAISSPVFMAKLYPDDAEGIRRDRTKYLVDMYLNTPDKGFLDTPLHFACKFNSFGVAKLLLSHPLCVTSIRNRDGLPAQEVIGNRAPKNNELMESIENLFLDTVIVPIWRDPGSQTQAVVGLPVNPKHLGHLIPESFFQHFNQIDLSLYGPADHSRIPPPSFGIEKVIKAYAGPMDESKAEIFYSKLRRTGGASGLSNSFSLDRTCSPFASPGYWPSCPSSPLPTELLKSGKNNSVLSTPGTPDPDMIKEKRLRITDLEKGVERVGRKYALDLNTPFMEHWNFAKGFLDIRSPGGLRALEEKLTKIEHSIAQLKKDTPSPISSLCKALTDCHLGSGQTPKKNSRESQDDWRVGLNEKADFTHVSRFRGSRVAPDFASLDEWETIKYAYTNSLDGKRKALSFDYADASFETSNSSSNESTPESVENLQRFRPNPNRRRKLSDKYYSARESPTDFSIFEDCCSLEAFIGGMEPNKEDYQLESALSSTIDDLLVDEYPAINRWYNSLKALGNRPISCARRLKL